MIDNTLILKDAGLVAADAAATVDGDAAIGNVGTGVVKGEMVVDITAIEIASNTEKYAIKLQGSSKADFASDIEDLAILEVGAAEVIGGDGDSAIGRYVTPFTNKRNGEVFRYLRVYTDVAGDIATGINFTAHIRPIQ